MRIPEEVVSDNGGQFTSTDFLEFTSPNGFIHTTASPHGAVESGVKIVKRLTVTTTGYFPSLNNIPQCSDISYENKTRGG